MRVVAYVALGGAIGSVARFALGALLQSREPGAFPWGTFVINVSGALLLGFLMRVAMASADFSPAMRALLTVGFCGGFTTFSTYSYETAVLLETGHVAKATTYAMGSALLALSGTFAGFWLAREYLDRA